MRPILICPTCSDKVILPEAAVRLTGRLLCNNGHSFEYNWRTYYNLDGRLKDASQTP